jgi:hypothetical protein
MTGPIIHPTITVNITIVIEITLIFSVIALGLVLRRVCWHGKSPRPRSRWRIDYESPTGLSLRITKAVPTNLPRWPESADAGSDRRKPKAIP